MTKLEGLIKAINDAPARSPLEEMVRRQVYTWESAGRMLAEFRKTGEQVYIAEVEGKFYYLRCDVQGFRYAEEIWEKAEK